MTGNEVWSALIEFLVGDIVVVAVDDVAGGGDGDINRFTMNPERIDG